MKPNSPGEREENSGSKEDCCCRFDPQSRKVHAVDSAEIFNTDPPPYSHYPLYPLLDEFCTEARKHKNCKAT